MIGPVDFLRRKHRNIVVTDFRWNELSDLWGHDDSSKTSDYVVPKVGSTHPGNTERVVRCILRYLCMMEHFLAKTHEG